MAGVQNEPDMLRIGICHHVVDLILILELTSQMSVESVRNAFFFQAPASKLLDRLGDVL